MRQVQTLEFRDEAAPDYLALYPRDQILDRITAEPGIVHNIISFLERPQKIASIEWNDTQVINTNLISINCFRDLIKTHNVYNKITGFRHFKANIEFSIVVNAQPFQQGGLLLWYLPQDGSSLLFSQRERLAGKTGCLSKVLNLADAQTLHMTVPFVNPVQWEDLIAPYTETAGNFYVTTYSPLQAGKAEITLFARFVNVKLAGPTPEKPASAFVPALAGSVIRTIGSVQNFEPQSTEAEEMISSDTITGKGPISTVARAVNDVANVVGTYFKPALIVTKPISWISAAIGQVATMFGWSKPISVETTSVVKLKSFRYMANYNGIDTSENLGLDADNQVDAIHAFATDVDEMQFDNIISIFNWGETFPWKVSDPVGTVLYEQIVSPMMCTSSSQFKSADESFAFNSILMQYLSFVSSFFRFWKGDIELQLRAFKTNYHSGRLRLIWYPGKTQGTPFADAESMAYSVLWDVRTTHTTKTIIPYMSNMPWLPVRTVRSITNNDAYEGNGVFQIVVLNPLRATDSVPQTVNINLEIAGARGFSFSVPKDPELLPTSAQAGAFWAEPGNTIFPAPAQFEAQIGDDSGMAEGLGYITLARNNGTLLDGEIYTIGEAVVSFRQLIKRFTPFWPTKAQINWPATGKVEDLNNTSIVTLHPYEFRYGQPMWTNRIDATKITFTVHPHDSMTLIGSIFAYYRGGVRVKAVGATGGNNLRAKLRETNEPAMGSEQNFETNFSAEVNVSTVIENGIEVQVPFYSRTSHIFAKGAPVTAQSSVSFYTPAKKYTTGDRLYFYRAAADDFSFGFLTGVPSLIWAPASGTILHA